jgi:hypothetical protein
MPPHRTRVGAPLDEDRRDAHGCLWLSSVCGGSAYRVVSVIRVILMKCEYANVVVSF